MREVRLPSGRRIILSDTVGFISDLPTLLVAAFRATLEEVLGAAIILHVRDIAHAESEAQAADVRRVLVELGLDPDAAGTRLFEVWNKIDRLDADQRAAVTADAARRGETAPALVSAVTGEGVAELLARVNALLGAEETEVGLIVAPTQGRFLHWLHEHTEIVSRTADDVGMQHLRIRVGAEKRGRLEHQASIAGVRIEA
jgi:GTP-binding protein HflX